MSDDRDLTDEENERLRGIVRQLVADRGKGGQSKLAEESGWSQAWISRFIAGGTGASVKRAVKACDLAGVPVSTVGMFGGETYVVPTGLDPRLEKLVASGAIGFEAAKALQAFKGWARLEDTALIATARMLAGTAKTAFESFGPEDDDAEIAKAKASRKAKK